MIKSLLIASALLFGGTFAQAQSVQPNNQAAKSQKRQDLTPQDRAIRALRMLSAKTNLTEAQAAEAKQIFIDRENARAEARLADGTMDPAKKESVKEANKKANQKLEALLSPEQMKQWEQFKQEQKARREAGKADSKQATRPEMEEDFY